jgi:hypothetical protein
MHNASDVTIGRPRLLNAEVLVFLALWLGLLAAGRDRMLRDPGTFWHTVVGRHILTTGAVLRHDPFSVTHAGHPWLAHQWLGETVMALVDRLSGLDGLLLAAVTLLAATYTWIVRRNMKRGLSWPVAVLITMMAVAASSYHFLPRPHLISIIFMGFLFARLCDYECGRVTWRGLLVLPPVFTLWANVHGGALGGLATLWLIVGGWLIFGRFLAVRPSVLPAFWIAAASSAAILVNPFGIDLPRTWIEVMTIPGLSGMIVEHAPLSLRSVDGWIVLAFALVYLAVLGRTVTRVPRSFRITWLMPLLWCALSIERIRHGPLFAILAALALGEMLSAGLPGRLSSAPQVADRPSAWQVCALPIAAVLLAMILHVQSIAAPLVGVHWARLDPTYWPTGAVAPLENALTGEPSRRVFNDMLYGGFLIYSLPDIQVWIDDRCELYGESGLRAYLDAARRHPERLEDWTRQHDINTALVMANSRFDRYLDETPHWRCEYRDSGCALYVRSDLADRRSNSRPQNSENPPLETDGRF